MNRDHLQLIPALIARGLLALGRFLRRCWWWISIRVRWGKVCRQSHLCEREHRTMTRSGAAGGPLRRERVKWVAPKIKRLKVRGNTVQVTVRARPGQTLTELETGAERLASTFDAHAYRTLPARRNPGSQLVVELVKRDALVRPLTATEPEPLAVYDQVRLGRTQGGRDWVVPIRGRHTLCVGASGAGKGSVLWGICCGLAPAVTTALVRLWGIDLKRGVELAMGAGLFATLAYRPEDAVDVLRDLVQVIDARGAEMVGKSRLHQPVVGDPLHVLVIDELAALTAYAPLDIRREADRLLAVILTQGRALGVVVVGFVQDPRKDVVTMRSLFTQTIALRLRSPEETAMVLGEGMTRLAPAHRINPTRPGTGWIVEDTGAVDRVRADYWPDELIQSLAERYSALPPLDDAHDKDVVDSENALTNTRSKGGTR